MRRRVGLIICLFAIFVFPTFVALGKKVCKGPSICAEARVYGGSKLRAKARVSTPSSVVKGRWEYSIKAGSKKKSDKGTYHKKVSITLEVEDYTSTASAYALNGGRTSSGKEYWASVSEVSGG